MVAAVRGACIAGVIGEGWEWGNEKSERKMKEKTFITTPTPFPIMPATKAKPLGQHVKWTTLKTLKSACKTGRFLKITFCCQNHHLHPLALQ